ncbi:transglycosylase domain-containing protein [Streptomyces sp. NPDC047022]|uniref:transglycosylase domain-containing protein n=1 Tax=Streptomyces sp. NPDC047022 TaxID=3155737 RepID=UPI0033F1AD5B
MGRAEERRARQRSGRRAAPKRSTGTTVSASVGPGAAPVGSRVAARAGARADSKKGKGKKGGIRRFFTWKTVLGSLFTFVLLVMGAFALLYMMTPIPDEANAAAQLESNVYYYNDGKTLLARTGDLNRENVDLSQVPKDVQHTFVAAENKTFYNDAGVDLKGTARGILNTLSGKGAQGGSTITQQYVKNYYLTQNQTVTRKLKELVISLKLDRQKSKDYILAGYINTSYYGRGAYGIQAAAQAYYRKDAKHLTVEEGAYLAALLQAPNQYDWAIATNTGKQLAQARWNYVLNNMVGQHWLDAGKRAAMKFPVPMDPKPAPALKGEAGYMVDAANTALENQLVAQGSTQAEAEARVKRGGWTITLNIDRKKQAQLERAVKDELTSKLNPKERAKDADVQPGAVSVDPKTGRVLAMYGGLDYFKHYVNNATRRDYQPASTFKPVILATALDQQAKTQDGQAIDANTIYDGTSGRPVKGSAIAFDPPNEDNHNYGPISVQRAMDDSVNSVFAQMGVDVGMQKVLKVADSLGLDTKGLPAVPAQTLGSMGASPMEMAGVYATLDNHGRKVTPAIIQKVLFRGGDFAMPNPIGGQVISPQAADTVTSVLTGVVDDGTARDSVAGNSERNDQQVAGKTGTSDSNKSAWFTGYTPNLVTSVGLFGQDAKTGAQVTLAHATGLTDSGGRINGGNYPAKIWAAYTFSAMGSVTKFELDTQQGAAVQPTVSPSLTHSPTSSPSSSPSTSKDPSPSKSASSKPPTSSTSPSNSKPPTSPPPSASIPPTSSKPPVDPIDPNPPQ